MSSQTELIAVYPFKSPGALRCNRCSSHTSKFIYHLQHGFRPGRLTESQLLVVYHDLLNIVASGKEIDAIYLDLSKAFDKVPHHLLLAKLSKYGISGSLHLWFQSYSSNRYQRAALEGVTSDWLSISSGVPQGSIPGPFLFVFFVNDLPDYIQAGSSLALFSDDYKLHRTPLRVRTPLSSMTWIAFGSGAWKTQ